MLEEIIQEIRSSSDATNKKYHIKLGKDKFVEFTKDVSEVGMKLVEAIGAYLDKASTAFFDKSLPEGFKI